MPAALPTPVRISFGTVSRALPPPVLGLLLDWRRRPDAQGRPQWEGLVTWAEPDGPDGWVVRLRWVWAPYIARVGEV